MWKNRITVPEGYYTNVDFVFDDDDGQMLKGKTFKVLGYALIRKSEILPIRWWNGPNSMGPDNVKIEFDSWEPTMGAIKPSDSCVDIGDIDVDRETEDNRTAAVTEAYMKILESYNDLHLKFVKKKEELITDAATIESWLAGIENIKNQVEKLIGS